MTREATYAPVITCDDGRHASARQLADETLDSVMQR
jgi:hypothetical protein